MLDIEVPKVLDLDSNHTETCRFVNDLYDTIRMGNGVRLIFDATTTVRQSALVFLLGHLHKFRLEYGPNCVSGTYPKNPRVDRLLTQSGFYDLLNIRSRAEAQKPSRTHRYIRFKSDTRVDASVIRQLREELLREDLSMPSEVARVVFRAISEAMTNVNHHAYHLKSFATSKAAGAIRGRWWLIGNLNVKQNLFTLAFYDTGVGIPKTLPRKYGMEMIHLALSKFAFPGTRPDDAEMIDAAMVIGRTRTGLSNRGKGLMDLAKLIDFVGAGKMQIYSRQGTYVYKAQNASSRKNGPGFLEGTLIEWQLPLDKALKPLPRELYENAETDS